MSTYEIIKNENFGTEGVKRIDADGKIWYIPNDPANSDYQRYLRWLENPEAEEGSLD